MRKPVRQLSLGERMKVEIVGSLLHRPRGLLSHEPANGVLRITGTTALVGTRDLGKRRRTPAPLVAIHNRRRFVRALLLSSLG